MTSGAERQRRYRERQAKRRTRERADTEADRLDGTRCVCCGETYPSFLEQVGEDIYCRNCAHMVRIGRLCPHRGIRARIG